MVTAGYVWRKGSPFRADANAFARQLQQLRSSDGTVSLEIVLDASRPEDAPLHGEIEWDDGVAAHKHRLHIVRSALGALRIIPVNIVREELLPPARAAIPVRMTFTAHDVQRHEDGDNEDRANAEGANVYRLAVTHVTLEEHQAQVRQEALSDIRRLASRLRTLPGCADLAEKLSELAEANEIVTEATSW